MKLFKVPIAITHYRSVLVVAESEAEATAYAKGTSEWKIDAIFEDDPSKEEYSFSPGNASVVASPSECPDGYVGDELCWGDADKYGENYISDALYGLEFPDTEGMTAEEEDAALSYYSKMRYLLLDAFMQGTLPPINTKYTPINTKQGDDNGLQQSNN